MRYMGIDYGTKRVGIALSDESGAMAFPESVIENNDSLLEKITDLIKEKEVEAVVMGESKDFKGKDNSVMTDIRDFQNKLEVLGIEVYLEPEFLTSHQAAQIQGENAMHDASAATIILNSYLSRQK